MRPKDYLHSKGLIDNPNQRGRMSLAHKEIIEQAVRDGVQIDGYTVSQHQPASAEVNAPVKVERKSSDGIADVPNEVRPEASWEAYTYVEGVKREVGMRTVCNGCRCSLTYCHCRTARVWVSSEFEGLVNFTPRTKPLPVNPWS